MGFMIMVQRACTLALVGILAGAIHSALSKPLQLAPKPPAPPEPTPTVANPGVVSPKAGASAETPKPAALGLDISVEQAWELFQSGTPFVDARAMNEYEEGHIDSALWMPSEEFMNGHTPEALQLLDAKAPVVVYCDGGLCDASKNVVVLLQQAGFTRCHILTDGYPGWVKAKHPIATGKPQIGGH
ncbi:MAG: hypothetical protein GC200_07235 [Tepidisphaera sp.]|nr:hypothetical protein [Tepidisphaera sp.]